jgi:hypothetical protein
MDFDFDAPGIHMEFGIDDSSIRGGIFELAEGFRSPEVPNSDSIQRDVELKRQLFGREGNIERLDGGILLKSERLSTLDVGGEHRGNLFILPCGRIEGNEYWSKISGISKVVSGENQEVQWTEKPFDTKLLYDYIKQDALLGRIFEHFIFERVEVKSQTAQQVFIKLNIRLYEKFLMKYPI